MIDSKKSFNIKDYYWFKVAIDIPINKGLFDYKSIFHIKIGTRVIVPFAKRRIIGIVIEELDKPTIDISQIKEIELILNDLTPFSMEWLQLIIFVSDYYQKSIGEIAINAIPNLLRKISSYSFNNKINKLNSPVEKLKKVNNIINVFENINFIEEPRLNHEQLTAVNTILTIDGFKTILLFGVTGSGKTEVYLNVIKNILSSGLQVLFLVPEINLTPQLENIIKNRFNSIFGNDSVVVMHSGLSDKERLFSWIQSKECKSKILLGTRMSIFAELPKLGLIIVDEEHDLSYKEQHGSRYSARDLAIWRARNLNIPIILGSATPSLETWYNAEQKKYLRLDLKHRAKEVSLPKIKIIDIRKLKLKEGFSKITLDSIKECIDKNKKVLIFINRRGYSPVLNCISCSWLSRCEQCTTFNVLHKNKYNNYLQCHHCGQVYNIPISCPECSSDNLRPMGYGTQRVEEYLSCMFPNAKILRIDADTSRSKNKAQIVFDAVNSNDINILIGTQMLTKGHDFVNLGLVCVLNTDMMIFSQDFRSSEKLFAQLMQVSGRAGRHNEGSQVIIQTSYPNNEIYKTLLLHDYAYFAKIILRERKNALLPPYSYHILIVSEAKNVSYAINFLETVKKKYHENFQSKYKDVIVFDPVPFRVLRIANIERAQLLVESINRSELHIFIKNIFDDIENIGKKMRIKWHLEIDPLEI